MSKITLPIFCLSRIISDGVILAGGTLMVLVICGCVEARFGFLLATRLMFLFWSAVRSSGDVEPGFWVVTMEAELSATIPELVESPRRAMPESLETLPILEL